MGLTVTSCDRDQYHKEDKELKMMKKPMYDQKESINAVS